jgi:peroxiredoxin
LELHKQEFETLGVCVAAVAIGRPAHAARYCKSITCLADAEGDDYQTYGLREGGLKELASPEVVAAGLRAAMKGHLPGIGTGNTLMMPGTFVIDRSGIVRYAYYSRHAGDHPPIESLMNAARGISPNHQG